VAARKTTSTTVRTDSLVVIDAGGLGIRAAYTLAGNMASIRANKHRAAATRVTGSTKPTAPSNSSSPVMVTSTPGAGNRGGTIAMRSARRRGAKCAVPVSTNMAASPTAIEADQLLT